MSERSGPGLRAIGEAITGVSVVLGLVFVGVQINQSTATAQAQSRQELAAQNIDFLMRIADNEGLLRSGLRNGRLNSWTNSRPPSDLVSFK